MRLAAVLLKGLSQTRQLEGSDMEPSYPDFNAALLTMAQRSASRNGKSAPPDARMFGKWLQRKNCQRQTLYEPAKRKARLGMVGRTCRERGVRG